jgi:hypothetical protein
LIQERRAKPEPFLHKPQKRFGTPRVSIVQWFTPVPRGRVGHPPRTLRQAFCHFNGIEGLATRRPLETLTIVKITNQRSP